MLCRPVRIYAELIPLSRLGSPEVVEALRGFAGALRAPGAGGAWSGPLELVVKVILPRSGEGLAPGLAPLLGGAGRASLGVDRVWVWGQLADRERVYLNLRSWEEVLGGWRRLLRELGQAGLELEGAFFDLEPDRRDLEVLSDSLVRGGAALASRVRLQGERREADRLASAVQRLRGELGVPILAACAPITVLPEAGVELAGRLVGTPLLSEAHGAIWPALACMSYVSFLLPHLGGVEARRAQARAAVVGGWIARRHVAWSARHGIEGSVICGTNCIGILGDEPSYPDAAGMAALMEVSAAAGPSALEIFNLTGVLYGPQGYDAGFAVREGRWRAWAAAVRRALGVEVSATS